MLQVDLAPGWELEVERGPDWLFVRPRPAGKEAAHRPPLAEQLWTLLENNLTHRLVLECDQLDALKSYLIGQLVALHQRIYSHAGLMRVCGLSVANQQILRRCRLDDRFTNYATRAEAVMGQQPRQPR